MQAASATIDLGAVRHNLGRVRQLAPASRVMAVLKANAYGHGLLQVAAALNAADAFAVARLEEALALRSGGITKPIVLLEGFFSDKDLPVLASSQIQTVVHIPEQLEALEQATLDSPVRVWLKLDTGMHRIGIPPEQTADYYRRLQACANVASPIRLMSHFGCADEPHNPRTLTQMAQFVTATGALEGERSLANSAGVVAWPDSHGDWVRPGIMLYGVSPILGQEAKDQGLKPVMTLKSSLIAIRAHQQGEPVGYGAAWTSDRDTFIGVVAIGYGDGYPRHLPSGTPVLIGGREYPLVGRVSMDMITVDLGPKPDVVLGDEVILWGQGLPVERIAELAETIPYELLCNITRRVRFFYQSSTSTG